MDKEVNEQIQELLKRRDELTKQLEATKKQEAEFEEDNNDPYFQQAVADYVLTGNASGIREYKLRKEQAAERKAAAEAAAIKAAEQEKREKKIAEQYFNDAEEDYWYYKGLAEDPTIEGIPKRQYEHEAKKALRNAKRYSEEAFGEVWDPGDRPKSKLNLDDIDEAALEELLAKRGYTYTKPASGTPEPVGDAPVDTNITKVKSEYTKFINAHGKGDKVTPYSYKLADLKNLEQLIEALPDSDFKNDYRNKLDALKSTALENKRKVTYVLDKTTGLYKKIVNGKVVGMVNKKGD